MNNKIFLFFAIIFIYQPLQTEAQDFYWVAFTDKNNSDFSLSYPEEYLSDRAIERRTKQNIPIDSLDLPVNSNYIDSVLKVGSRFIHASKWLNGITVQAELAEFSTEVLKYSFVKEIQLTKPLSTTKSAFTKFNEPASEAKEPIDTSFYGPSVYQTGLMNGQYLHNQGYNGEGMQIAILDGGFYNADTYRAFDSLWVNNQILGVKDFVNPNSDIFETASHGMSVLSCIGGNLPDTLIGTARKSSFWLLLSEDTDTEYLIEEDNWVVAAEFADSVGVDIINSSLGYYEFDDSNTDHTYADMDGKTTRVTRGANIAASRGMLVFSSAGNEGNKSWKYIIAPSDGDNVIGVGAVNKFGFTAYFTSYGPASDGDIKPNVSAVGMKTYLQLSNGMFGEADGTSFSSPVMAGMAACLWQANPDATAVEVKNALEKSAHLYETPDSRQGYGIPDMKLADQILGSSAVFEWETVKKWKVYPNPVENHLILEQKNSGVEEDIEIRIYSVDGRLIKEWVKQGASRISLDGLQTLPLGILLMKVNSNYSSETIKLYKYH